MGGERSGSGARHARPPADRHQGTGANVRSGSAEEVCLAHQGKKNKPHQRFFPTVIFAQPSVLEVPRNLHRAHTR